MCAAILALAGCAPRVGDPAPEPTAPETTAPAAMTSLPALTTSTSSTHPTGTIDLGTSPAPPANEGPVCERYSTTIVSEGSVANPILTEVSGIAASRANPGTLWVHNDSGGDPAVYAVGADGADLGAFPLEGVVALDWEDMALGPGPDPERAFLYVGDIGDNFAFRPQIFIFRVAEPDPASPGPLTDVATIRLVYPDPGVDAEALAVDPLRGDLFVFTKEDGRSRVYRAAAEALDDADPVELRLVATLQLPEGVTVTAADFTGDGSVIGLRSYEQVWLFARRDLDAAAAFTSPPCSAPSPEEVQGEALTFDPRTGDYLTISEGRNKEVFRVSRIP